MIVSGTGYNSESMSSCNLQKSTVLHTPPSDNTVYSSAYLVDSNWSHHQQIVSVKQEPEDTINNDSGISPNSYNSDSRNNMSPASYHSEEPRSVDSGNVDNKSYQSPLASPPNKATIRESPLASPPNKTTIRATATVGVVTPSIMNSAQSPSNRSTSPTDSTNHLRQSDKHNDENSRSSSSASSNSAELDNSYYEEDSLRRLQMCIQRTGIMGPSPQNTSLSESANAEKSLQCPLCGFITNSRSNFNEHLTTHSDQVKCKRCDHTAENKDKLREHLRDVHNASMTAEDEAGLLVDSEEPGIAVPKVNSQGKVKTYRCKQCNFSAVTKLDFWEHSRVHIKAERQLTCPKCRFVTEYKHHLEYHLLNHYGTKPFQCSKCSYTCVNKSMLNSHMKSHSNVYQFRCLNCNYATKYCHSLKLHLRKYIHNPAPVLYPDGSLNPYPIVDVYGTRRGPKQKSKKTGESRVKSPQPQKQPTPQPVQPISPIFPAYGFVPSGNAIPFAPHLALMNNFSNGSPLFPFQNNPAVTQDAPKMDLENIFPGNNNNNISSINNNQQDVKEYLTRVFATQQEVLARSKATEDCQSSAIDMTKTEQSRMEQQDEESTEKTVTPPPSQMSNKNRRKGKAFKLDTIARRLQHQNMDYDDDEVDKDDYKVKIPRCEEIEESVKEEPEIAEPEKMETRNQEEMCSQLSPIVDFSDDMKTESTISKERKERWRNLKEVYDCSYCDILFGDIVMYTMHMGYHGYQHPYTCNMCGHQTSTRVDFFLHLFRNSHG